MNARYFCALHNTNVIITAKRAQVGWFAQEYSHTLHEQKCTFTLTYSIHPCIHKRSLKDFIHFVSSRACCRLPICQWKTRCQKAIIA